MLSLDQRPLPYASGTRPANCFPARKTKGGTRYYSMADLTDIGDADAPTVCYARVSSHDQKADLGRQMLAERQATAAVIADDLGLYHADSQQD